MVNANTTASSVKAVKPKPCKRLPAGATKAERLLAHKREMDAKTLRRERDWLEATKPDRVMRGLARSTSIGDKPHAHRAEIARRKGREVSPAA